MRLSVVLLGAKCSGKTSLARAALRCQSPELSLSSELEKSFDEHRVQANIEVLDTQANTPEQKLWLGQELARRTVKVALVTIPRNAPDTNEARVWSVFARENCPNAHVAVVVTKNDINGTAARASSSSRYACSGGEQFLQDHTFENSVYDLMQCAGGADQLFYTSSQERRGTDDLRHWILDMCTDEDPLEDFGWANTAGKGGKSRRKKKHRDQACAMEGCETCTVQ